MSQQSPDQPRRIGPSTAGRPEPDIYADNIEIDTTAADLAVVNATQSELARRGVNAAMVRPGGIAIGTVAAGLVVLAVAVSVIVLALTGSTIEANLGLPVLLLVLGTVLAVNAGVGLVQHRREGPPRRRPD